MVPVHSIYTAHTKQGFVQNMMIVYCSYYDASMMEVYIYQWIFNLSPLLNSGI